MAGSKLAVLFNLNEIKANIIIYNHKNYISFKNVKIVFIPAYLKNFGW